MGLKDIRSAAHVALLRATFLFYFPFFFLFRARAHLLSEVKVIDELERLSRTTLDPPFVYYGFI